MGVTRPRAIIAAGLLALAVAAPSIRNEFVSDDVWVIQQRPLLHHPPSLSAVLEEPYWPMSFGGALWRPAVLSSYAIDYRISDSPHWFHAENALWAGISTALFTLLACELAGPIVGLIAGLLFAVHPVHVEAVANVVGRAELMAAAGYAVALVCALRAQGRPVYLIGVAAGAAFGIASKELVATLPASVLLLYTWKRADMRMGWKAAVVAAIPIGAYYVLHEWIGAGVLTSGGTAAGLERLGMAARAWAMLPLSLQWWRLLLFPAHLSADYSPAELTVSTGFTLGHVLALTVWALAGLLAWRTRHAIPGIALGLVWLIITVAPVSNVLLPTELLIAERTLYLPSFGVVFALASIGVALPWPARVRVGLLALVLTLGIVRSVARIPAWHDDDMHFEALKREAPRSYRTLWLEGDDEFARGQWGRGERLLEAAITAAPVIAGPRYDLARFYMKARLWQPAIRELQAAITVDSAFAPARDALRDAEDSARQDRRRQ